MKELVRTGAPLEINGNGFMLRSVCTDGNAQNSRNMKTFLMDLLTWMVTPYSYGLYLEACYQERLRRWESLPARARFRSKRPEYTKY